MLYTNTVYTEVHTNLLSIFLCQQHIKLVKNHLDLKLLFNFK